MAEPGHRVMLFKAQGTVPVGASEGPVGMTDAWWLVERGIFTHRELPAHRISWQHSEN